MSPRKFRRLLMASTSLNPLPFALGWMNAVRLLAFAAATRDQAR